MRVEINVQVCEGHGQCEDAAPEVFQVREGAHGYHSVVVNEHPDAALREKLGDAVRRCPNEAIRLID